MTCPLAGTYLLVLTAFTFVAIRPALADDAAAAQTLYDQAKQLVVMGNYADACPKFEASYRADPQLGVLLNLADCHEKIGRTATAWAEFRTAIDIAKKKNDARQGYAEDRVATLEPKLDKLRIVPPASRPPGLVVTRDGTDITALLDSDAPVDPGQRVIAASAHGYAPWQTTVNVTGEGATSTVSIGALAKLPEAPEPQVDAPEPVKTWGGVIALVGTSFDGLESNPSSHTTDPNLPGGHGVRALPGVRIGGRARIHVAQRIAVEPGVFFHYKRIYMEQCAPNCHEIEEVDVSELEVPVMLRLAALRERNWSLGLYAGPYIAVRFATHDGGMPVESLTSNPSSHDLGFEAGIDLEIYRIEAQAGLLLGTTNVSKEADSSILGFGLAVGARL